MRFYAWYDYYMSGVHNKMDNFPGVRLSSRIKGEINQIGWFNSMKISSHEHLIHTTCLYFSLQVFLFDRNILQTWINFNTRMDK